MLGPSELRGTAGKRPESGTVKILPTFFSHLLLLQRAHSSGAGL